jgi:Mrp family chromosome partitioning ATPase/capsular polysaccharide biosynthesis protein
MTFRQSLYVMRRWRSVIVAGVVIGIVVGWVSARGAPATTTTFEATHILILQPGAAGSSQLSRYPAVATLGAVPNRVAARLGIDRRNVQSVVYARNPAKTDLLLIIARSNDRARAEALANVTAEELIIELGGPKAPLGTLEPATASRVTTRQFDGPRSGPGRALLLGVFGLFLAIGAAFVVERFDNRIRSRRTAEEILGVPVMVEVPALPRSHRGRALTGGQPSQFIEAYRRLRTSVDRWTTRSGNGDGCRLIVVTSPVGGEGATTTVAHLAATLGEIGRSVIAISADLRHPQLHLYFDKAREPGLTDVLRDAPDARRLADLNLATTVRGVRFVASGASVRNPAPLLEQLGDHLRDARNLGDYVLIDAPPLLTTSDGADLARHADGVLLVVRAGRTSVGAARRSAELLQRLGIPVLGAVLVGSDSSAVRT